MDSRSRILAADPAAAHVEVQLHGHTDGTWNGASGKPGDCFDFRDRAGRNGSVAEPSQRVLRVSSNGCREMD